MSLTPHPHPLPSPRKPQSIEPQPMGGQSRGPSGKRGLAYEAST